MQLRVRFIGESELKLINIYALKEQEIKDY